ncbi:hypothetical protein [Natronorubrum sp. FCH18a]|uniref:hypothetical protein n=1 Tax=Natronorubrum sp. FCH18a TaxID=3447018 RepID=UPI003F51539C
MNTDTNDSNKSTEETSTNLAETIGVVRASLETIEDSDPVDERRCEARVDETGRYWLADPTNADEAYIWTRQTIDVEAVR